MVALVRDKRIGRGNRLARLPVAAIAATSLTGGQVVLWHASFNFVTASPSAAGLAAAVTSVLVVAWPIVLLMGGALKKSEA
jgi:drug/metabolite transporter (DMT)-like permease